MSPLTAGRIGPNAVIRLAEATRARRGAPFWIGVAERAGLARYGDREPDAMVASDEVSRLHRALFDAAGAEEALVIGAEAGRLTATYLLGHRIPRPAQIILGLLPRSLALSLLLKAIARHSWTFAGTGEFSYNLRPEPVLVLRGSPVARDLAHDGPVCAYFAATFETLFRAIISPDIRVREIACEAAGAGACRFAVEL